MFENINLSPQFEERLSQLKQKAVSWGEDQVVELFKKRKDTRSEEETIEKIAQSIAYSSLEKFEEDLMSIDENERLLKGAFYREEESFFSFRAPYKEYWIKRTKEKLNEYWAKDQKFNSRELSLAIQKIGRSQVSGVKGF